MITRTAHPARAIRLKPAELRGIFRASEELLDYMEDILERHRAYQPEFIKGLKASFAQAKTKNFEVVSSLKSL